VTLGDFPVEPEVAANTRAFGDALRQAGAVVEEVTVDLSLTCLTEAALVHYGSIMGPSMSEEVDPQDPRFMPYTRQFLSLSSAAFQRTSVYAGMEMETQVHLAIARIFADHEALVCPTFGGLGLRAGEMYADGIDVAGQHLDLYIFAALTPVFNVASRHPVLAVPSGLASNGVPTGVQVVARPYDDVTAYHVGAAAERELGLWHDPVWRPTL
jgi:aspartyl-tRNA(Asn)/glutamyl-tRNA(Gln) amidotransferase subunit A